MTRLCSCYDTWCVSGQNIGGRWTAEQCLSGRIADSDKYRQWISDFEYEVVRIHDYSNEELLEREGCLKSGALSTYSIQPVRPNREGLPRACDGCDCKGDGGLCFKIDASTEERTQCVQKVRKREMEYLFENMERMSLQEERRKTEEQRQRADAEHQRADAAEESLRTAKETIGQLLEKIHAAQ